MSPKLQLHEPDSAVQAAPDLASANYILTSVSPVDDRAYAWFNQQEFDAGPRAAVTKDHSPGCSATSQYPVRSDWVALDSRMAGSTSRGAESIRVSAGEGAWRGFELADTPTGASAGSYYSLVMVHATGPVRAGHGPAGTAGRRSC